jgi:hypothetical protein
MFRVGAHALRLGLTTPYLVQSSELDRPGEPAQAAPGQGHAAIEPSHDVKGDRIPKEP